MKKQSKRIQFLWMEIILIGIVFFQYYDSKVESYNTTLYAFHYGCGFISRGFIGSIYHLVDMVLPVNMIDYHMAIRFTQVVTSIFFFVIIAFVYQVMKKAKESSYQYIEYLIVLFTLFSVSMYSSARNFGRVDIYMIMVSLLAGVIILKEKGEFLLIPLVAIGMMFHQGYVFMYLNVILVLLIYQFFTHIEHKRMARKYAYLFVATFLVGSVLFLYFEFFSRSNGTIIVNEIIENAKALSFQGKYHKTLVQHEILNVDLAEDEWNFHLENFVQTPFFIAFLLPAIFMTFQLFRRIWKKTITVFEKITYFFVLAGPLTLLPNYILKVDYARWTMALIAYYCIVFVVLLTKEDEIITEAFREQVSYWRKKGMWVMFILPYMVIFIPFWDVYYNDIMKDISNWMDQLVLHWGYSS